MQLWICRFTSLRRLFLRTERGRGGTPPYSPTLRAHTIKGSWGVVAALCWLCFLVFLVKLLSFYIVFEIHNDTLVRDVPMGIEQNLLM